MNMHLELNHDTPVIVRKFNNPQELETWFKELHNGNTFPEVDRRKEVEFAEDKEAVKQFFQMLDMKLDSEETLLNPYTNRLEMVEHSTQATKTEIKKTDNQKVVKTEFKTVVKKTILEW